jgi:hypothetical protein
MRMPVNSALRHEELYRNALSSADEQGAKLWELRAAVSPAPPRRGRHAEARELLAPAYGWFTEGFDTPDLKKDKGAARVACAGITRSGNLSAVPARRDGYPHRILLFFHGLSVPSIYRDALVLSTTVFSAI